jgi:ketosteroid isomerase-like protein
MVELDPDRVAIRFVNEINRHDVSALTEMMAPDVRFVDGLGQEVRGKERVREAWSSYFAQFPDYRISIREHLVLGQVVGLFGTASGTAGASSSPGERSRWSLPAAWRAIVREGRVAEWQVYADNEPVWKAMGVKRY